MVIQSNEFIDLLEPKDKPYQVYDQTNLYIEVPPKGDGKKNPQKKRWRTRYKFNGKDCRLSLGTYPKVNLESARIAYFQAIDLLEMGVDPKTIKKSGGKRSKTKLDIDKILESVPNDAKEDVRKMLEIYKKNYQKDCFLKSIENMPEDFKKEILKEKDVFSTSKEMSIVRRMTENKLIDSIYVELSRVLSCKVKAGYFIHYGLLFVDIDCAAYRKKIKKIRAVSKEINKMLHKLNNIMNEHFEPKPIGWFLDKKGHRDAAFMLEMCAQIPTDEFFLSLVERLNENMDLYDSDKLLSLLKLTAIDQRQNCKKTQYLRVLKKIIEIVDVEITIDLERIVIEFSNVVLSLTGDNKINLSFLRKTWLEKCR